MHRLTALCSCLLLGSCATALPTPSPDMAWIELRTIAGNQLIAQELDKRTWNDGRYFEVNPGAHALQVNFSFDLPGGGSGGGRGMGDETRTCVMTLSYDTFSAGQRYQLRAGKMGYQPWIRLYDQQQQVVARGQTLRCPAY